MPETKNKQLCSRFNPNIRNDDMASSQIVATNRVCLSNQRQPTDFTSNQKLKLRAGDLRMARMQISLAKLRLEMEQSKKLIEQLCKAAQLDRL